MSDLYDESDPANPLVSPKGYALLLGVPFDEFRAEVDRQKETAPSEPFAPPPLWLMQGRRRSTEYQSRTGRTDMRGALDYWQKRASQ